MCFKRVLVGHILCSMWKHTHKMTLQHTRSFYFFPKATLYTFSELAPSLVDSCNCRKAAQSHFSLPWQSYSGHRFKSWPSFFGVHPCDVITVKSWRDPRDSQHMRERAENFLKEYFRIYGILTKQNLFPSNKTYKTHSVVCESARCVPLPGPNQRRKHRNVHETHAKKKKKRELFPSKWAYFPRAKHSSFTVEPLATWTNSGNWTSIFGSYSPITPEERRRRASALVWREGEEEEKS